MQFHKIVSNAGLLAIFLAILFSPCFAQDDAVTLQRRSIRLLDSFVDHLRKTGDRQSLLPQLRQAEKDLLISSQAFLNNGDLANATVSLIKLGAALRLQERWVEAKSSYKVAYEIAVHTGDAGNQAKALWGMAMVESYGLQNNDAAASNVEEAIRLSSSGVDKKALYDALELKAQIQENRGDLIAAADTINRAHVIASGLKDDMSLYYAFSSRASIYAQLGKKCDERDRLEECLQAFNRAKSDYEQALSIAKRLGYNYVATHMNRSLVLLEKLRQMMEGERNTNDRLTKTSIFNPKTPDQVLVTELFLSREQDQDTTAEWQSYFEEIKKYSRDAVGYFVEGGLLLRQGQDDAASQVLMKAVELLDTDRRSLRDGVVLGSFLEDKMNIYYYPLEDFLDRRRYAEAFDLLERSKSRAMADLLRSQELELKGPAERKFYADSVNLDAKISSSQKKLFKLRSEGESGGQIAAIEREIQKLNEDRQNLVKKISTEGLRLRELVAPQTATLAQLQQAMRQDRFEVLSYLVMPSKVILWHISGDAINVRSIYLPRLALIKKVTSLRQSLSERDGGRTFDEQTARELFLFLVQPALQWIKTDHLVIIPHDDLSNIPFQVLQNPADNKFLGETFRLSYIPNATTLLKLKKMESIRGGNLLAAANPYIVDSEDVQAIGNLHSGRNKIITDRLIDEASLKAQVADYKLVHLSVHGKFVREAPLLSYLELSKGGSDDGKLTAAEMFGLPLAPNSLVVLSACDTGQAQATRANEVLGMVRALLYAGANNLILSSWSVDAASTAIWMETFYREAESKPLSEAARQALLAVKNDPKYSHPYYWSPFLLIGK